MIISDEEEDKIVDKLRKEINSIFDHMKKDLIEYIDSEDFRFEWIHWEVHEGSMIGRFRRDLEYYTLEKERNFPYPVNDEDFENMKRMILYIIIGQTNFMWKQMPRIRDNIIKVRKLMKTIINIAFDMAMGYDQEVEDNIWDYVNKIKCAIIIQRQWRESISNPKYNVCRKRLIKELTELSNT